jgi:GT2 family glycosyltransferase
LTAAPAPAISVVVPTKGRPRHLERCLAALAAAASPTGGFETLVVDDSGGPEVERVAATAPCPASVRVVRPRGKGPSAARNAGAFAARGRHVAFTDDDCEPDAGWLVGLERALDANPGCAAGGVTRNGAAGDPAAEASQMVVEAVQAQFNSDPAAPRFFASYNVAFPAAEFRAIGGFDECFRYAEDRELCERWIASGHRFVLAPEALVLHMRRLTLRDFWRQHHGYGRGARAFRDAREPGPARRSEAAGIQRALLDALVHSDAPSGRLALAGYLGISQAATASGFAREAIAARLRRSRAAAEAAGSRADVS